MFKTSDIANSRISPVHAILQKMQAFKRYSFTFCTPNIPSRNPIKIKKFVARKNSGDWFSFENWNQFVCDTEGYIIYQIIHGGIVVKRPEDSELEDAVTGAFAKNNKRKCWIWKSFNCLKFWERHSRMKLTELITTNQKLFLVKQLRLISL